jgi:hypothetical protein
LAGAAAGAAVWAIAIERVPVRAIRVSSFFMSCLCMDEAPGIGRGHDTRFCLKAV